MCGICGYIGRSESPDLTHGLMTHLFDFTEIRGEDAAGVWGAVNDNSVVFHKEPVKSSIFVRRPMWQHVGELNPDLLVCHARAASVGVGAPSINKNNHPFISADGRTGLVHNGRIPDVEYTALKKKYPTLSACDSEIVLRILEAGEAGIIPQEEIKADAIPQIEDEASYGQHLTSRLVGMKNIWSFLSLGQMAVAVGEMQQANVRRLWLFRNRHRSLWLADMRTTLNQVFFFSTPEIWKRAVEKFQKDNSDFKHLISGGIKLVELPTEEVWLLTTTPQIAINDNRAIKRFEVVASGIFNAWNEEDIASVPAGNSDLRVSLSFDDWKKIKDEPANETCQVITELDEDERPKETPVTTTRIGFATGTTSGSTTKTLLSHGYKPPTTATKTQTVPPPKTTEIKAADIDEICDNLANLAIQIKTTFTTNNKEGGVTQSGMQELAELLQQTELDLTGTLQIAEKYDKP